MGAHYTQLLVHDSNAERCANLLRELRRTAVVIPAEGEISVICDQQSEDQNIDVIDSLALTVSVRLKCAVVALMNNDDDWLAFRFFDNAEFCGDLLTGHTPFSLRGSIFRLRRLTNPRASLIALILTFLTPVIFQTQRHARLIPILGLPPRSLGVGFGHISTGRLRSAFDKNGLIFT
jgi:hypothetical protein